MKARRFQNSDGDAESRYPSLLTSRERQVAALVALGHTNLEVASLLRIHQKTVETHRKHIMTKLGLRSRADLVRFAFSQGLVNQSPGRPNSQTCTGCQELWVWPSQFLSDPAVKFAGYDPAHSTDSLGALVFRHERCRTKLDLSLESFVELAGEPLLAASCGSSGRKAEYCLGKSSEQSCPPRCVCAFVWRTSQIIDHWPISGKMIGARSPVPGGSASE